MSPLWFCRSPHPNEPAGRAAQLSKTFLKYTKPSCGALPERGAAPGAPSAVLGAVAPVEYPSTALGFSTKLFFQRLTSNPLTNRTAIPGLVPAVTEPREFTKTLPMGAPGAPKPLSLEKAALGTRGRQRDINDPH